MRVPAADLHAQIAPIEADIRSAIDRVLASQQFILGPEVEAFERELAAALGCRHAIGVSSGTDALLVALMALGIGPGDEVITTPFTFFATAGTVHRLGARPVFVDIDPETFNIDAAAIEPAITERTRAILPVHLFGRCADLGPILDLGARHGIPVIEDAAQSIGASWDGRAAGTLGTAGCLSFFPAKNLGAFGDAGAVVLDDDALADRIRILRAHGSRSKYHHHIVGGNFRLDAIQAAVLRAKLPHLGEWSARRRDLARRYHELLHARGLASGRGPLRALPLLEPLADQVFNQFVVCAADRDALQRFLGERGVATAVYYPVPLHLQPCFEELGHATGDLPAAERAAGEVLALPIHAELTDEQLRYVVDCIEDYRETPRETDGAPA